MRKVLSALTDVLLAVAAVVVLWSVGSNYVQSTRQSPRRPYFEVGRPLPVTGVDWQKADHNLVLVLSVECQFCKKSGPFYERVLAAVKSKQSVRAHAVFPMHGTAQGQEFLNSIGVSTAVEVVGNAPIGSRVAFPTILWVDASGKVQSERVGKLAAQDEENLLKKIQAFN